MEETMMKKAIAAGIAAALMLTGCAQTSASAGASAAQAQTSQAASEAASSEKKSTAETAAQTTENADADTQVQTEVSAAVTESADSASSEVSALAEGAQVIANATATIKAEPDIAEIVLGVTTQSGTAEEAQSQNTETINNILSVLNGMNIKDSDLKTSGYNMYPQYDYNNSGVISGYSVTTQLTISDQNVNSVGEIIDKSVKAGATDINGITYSCSEYDSLYEKALTEAVQAAQNKAQVIAQAADAEIDGLVNITEGQQDTSLQYQDYYASGLDESSKSGTTIVPGEVDIKASVSATYSLK